MDEKESTQPPIGGSDAALRLLNLRRYLPYVAPVVFAAVLWLLHRELADIQLRTVRASLAAIPGWRLAVAGALTTLAYLVISAYDSLGFRFVGERVAWRRIALASFVGHAFSNALGHTLLTGIPIRMRFYTAWKVSAERVASVLTFGVLSYWLGQAFLAGTFFAIEPLPLPGKFSQVTTRPLGALLLAAVALYLIGLAGRIRPLEIRGRMFQMPRRATSLLQILVGSADLALAATVLYVLVPAEVGLSFPTLICAFLFANLLGVLSTLPGGLGVFDTALLMLLPDVPPGPLVAAILAYRAIYFLLPLAAAVATLGVTELHRHRQALGSAGRVAERWNAAIAPQVLSAATFLVGLGLLASGAIPADGSRLAALGKILPLAVIETSHFVGSLIGLGLMVLARGLQRRVRSAFHLVATLLAVGVVMTLLKGLAYEGAAVLGILLLSLIACRERFDRKASITSAQMTPAWIAMIASALVLTLWLVLLSYRQVDFADQLWWRFALYGEAPRAMRALVGVGASSLAIALLHWLRPATPAPGPPTPEDLERAIEIACEARRANTRLVALGDKSLLFDSARTGFLMYAIEGRSWIALGDPVAPRDSMRELLWRFQSVVERADGWPVFYQVREQNLGHYVDLGLSLLKLGEEGHVPLAGFTLQGGAKKDLRQTLRKLGAAGLSFEFLPATEVEPLLPRLREISDAWLADKNTREKGFSLGYFDAMYLCRFPLAVVRSGPEILAFANVFEGHDKADLTVDLMRYGSDAPRGIMISFSPTSCCGEPPMATNGSPWAWHPWPASRPARTRPCGIAWDRSSTGTGSISTTSADCGSTRRNSIRSGSRAISPLRTASRCHRY